MLMSMSLFNKYQYRAYSNTIKPNICSYNPYVQIYVDFDALTATPVRAVIITLAPINS